LEILIHSLIYIKNIAEWLVLSYYHNSKKIMGWQADLPKSQLVFPTVN